jgi:hypothetical protein
VHLQHALMTQQALRMLTHMLMHMLMLMLSLLVGGQTSLP